MNKTGESGERPKSSLTMDMVRQFISMAAQTTVKHVRRDYERKIGETLRQHVVGLLGVAPHAVRVKVKTYDKGAPFVSFAFDTPLSDSQRAQFDVFFANLSIPAFPDVQKV